MIDWDLSRKGLVFHDGAWIAESTMAEYHAAGLCYDLKAHTNRKAKEAKEAGWRQ